MVKRLDEKPEEPAADHIGWSLWRAAEAWKRDFEAGMVARGHDWFAEARGGVLRHLDGKGTPQSDLAGRMRITKQAVQQLVDQLEGDGIVARFASDEDRRNRLVILTAKGKAAMRDASDVKRAVEARIAAKLGKADFERLRRLLDLIAS